VIISKRLKRTCLLHVGENDRLFCIDHNPMIVKTIVARVPSGSRGTERNTWGRCVREQGGRISGLEGESVDNIPGAPASGDK